MTDTPVSTRISFLLTMVAGVVLVAVAWVADMLFEKADWLRFLLVGCGCTLGALGVAARRTRLISTLAKVSLFVLSATSALGLAEMIPRAWGHNFARRREPGPEIPIYYRAPSLHAGEGVFRRPGPDSWHGHVLRSFMRAQGWNEAPYAEEQAIQVDYDGSGFRNPTNLLDWEVVVTGDSFVELGHLPESELFTTLAGKRLGVRIKNLGVSTTGPRSQTYYLKRYGRAESTRDAVLCFFEGNDLEDLSRELRQADFFAKTGRPWQEEWQPSFLCALFDSLVRVANGRPRVQEARKVIDAPTGGKQPPRWERLGAAQKANLVRALADWADTAHSLGLRAWVMYLPDGQRVFHGLSQHDRPAQPAVAAPPGDFFSGLEAACTNLNIRFINTYPALRQAATSGQVPYNQIGDRHFNRVGSHIVADVLADALQAGR